MSNPLRIPTALKAAAVLTLLVAPRRGTSQTSAESRSDLGYLMSAIKSVHPAPYHRRPESDFDSAAARLSRDIPILTSQQIAVRMQAIMALLEDGHSHVQLADPAFHRQRFFGVRIDRLADGMFVTATTPDLAVFRGSRVIRIGNLPAADAWDSLVKISSGDNVFSRMAGVPAMLMMPEILSATGISSADTLILTLATKGGERRVAVRPQSGAFSRQWSTSKMQESASVPVSERHRNEPYWFVREGPVVYAQINQIQSSKDTVELGSTRGVVSLPAFGARLVSFADTIHADRLIIDIRYNGGGDNTLAKPVVQSIVEHPRLNRRGHLFVITGRETYSAAMNFASMLEDGTEAIFVGEPPGGTPAHYGDATRFVMPASKIAFYVSTLHWDTGVRPTDVREVMEPDIPVPPRFTDVTRGIDAAYEAAIAYKEGDLLSDRLINTYRKNGLDSAFAEYDRGARASTLGDPWHSDVQQLLDFAWNVIPVAKTRDDIFRAFSLVNDRYPNSAEAWVATARVHAFIADWPSALAALQRARELRPQNDYIRRSYEAAKLR
jgi:hypothetical protein